MDRGGLALPTYTRHASVRGTRLFTLPAHRFPLVQAFQVVVPLPPARLARLGHPIRLHTLAEVLPEGVATSPSPCRTVATHHLCRRVEGNTPHVLH